MKTAIKAAAGTAAKLERSRQLLDAGEPTLESLAAKVGLSPSHLQRSFTARFGLSPAQYLAQRKLGALGREGQGLDPRSRVRSVAERLLLAPTATAPAIAPAGLKLDLIWV